MGDDVGGASPVCSIMPTGTEYIAPVLLQSIREIYIEIEIVCY